MKLLIGLIVTCASMLLGLPAQAASYGNAAATFGWITPSVATDVNFAGTCSSGGSGSLDDAISVSGAIVLPFPFTYGSVAYTTVQVSTNGRLQFGGNSYCGTRAISNSSLNRAMAPVNGLDLDLKTVGASSLTTCSPSAAAPDTCFVRYGSSAAAAPNRQFVVSFVGAQKFGTTAGRYTFQIILNEDGSFVYQYTTLGSSVIPAWQLSTADNVKLTAMASSAGTAVRFFVPVPLVPLATYSLDQTPFADTSGSGAAAATAVTSGVTLTPSLAKVCKGVNIASNTSSATTDALSTPFTVGSTLKSEGTISFWWNSSTAWNSGTRAQLLDASTAASNWFYLARGTTGRLYFRLTDSAGSNRLITGSTLTYAANTWHFITVNWSFPNGRMELYVDAVRRGTTTLTVGRTISTSVGSLYVGDNRSTNIDTGSQGTANSAAGMIDEVRVYGGAQSALEVTKSMASTHPCPSTLHHIRLSHDGSANTCLPEPVKVIACGDAACLIPYTSGVTNISLSPTAGVTWSPGTTVSIPAGSSTLDATIAYTSNITLATTGTPVPTPASASDCFNTTTGALSCAMVFGPNLDIVVADHVAGTPKVAAGTICNTSFSGQSRTVKLWASYSDPTTGTKQARVVTGGAGNADCSTGYTTIGTTLGTATSISLPFSTSAVAPQTTLTFCYPDVGRIDLNSQYNGSAGTGDAGTVITGKSTFVVSPYSFTVTGTGIPGAADATGSAFATAGNNFTATVTAVNKQLVATPNFGKTATPEGVELTAVLQAPAAGSSGLLTCNGSTTDCVIDGSLFSGGAKSLSNFSWSEVGIMKMMPLIADGDFLGTGQIAPTSPDDKSGNIGRFIPHHFAYSDRSASVQARSGRTGCWRESNSDLADISAGMTLLPLTDATPYAVGDGMVITGAGAGGADLRTTVTNVNTTTNTVTLQDAAVTAILATPVFQKVGFTYMSEGLLLGFSLVAQNAANATTVNYISDTVTPSNDFNKFTASAAKVSASGADSWGLAMAAESPFVALPGRAVAVATDTPSVSWNAGLGDFVANVQLNQPATTPDGPYPWVAVGILPVDKDGVTIQASDKDLATAVSGTLDRVRVGAAEVRQGRAKLNNVYGSELRPLNMPVVVQYFKGGTWITSADDSCTPLTRDTTVAHPTALLAPDLGALTLANSVSTVTRTVAVSALGRGGIDIAAPNTAGYVDITWPVKPYMMFPWVPGGAYIDPVSRATFGVFKSPLIYLRENY